MKKFLLPLAAITLMCACTSAPVKDTNNPAYEQSALEKQQVKSALERVANSKINYKIQQGDLLKISVFKEQDMDRVSRVGADGYVAIPLAGRVIVKGLTVTQAERALEQRLRSFLVAPQVSVFIEEYGNKSVFVLGEVKKPGSIDLPNERSLSVLEAITMAGGFTEIAAQNRTKVIRSKNGRTKTFEIEVDKITKQGDKSVDIILEPGDTVIVPQSFF